MKPIKVHTLESLAKDRGLSVEELEKQIAAHFEETNPVKTERRLSENDRRALQRWFPHEERRKKPRRWGDK